MATDSSEEEDAKQRLVISMNSVEEQPSSNRSSTNDSSGTSNGEASFDWPSYLKETKSVAAPAECFYQPVDPGPNHFREGMAFCAKDSRSSNLCAAKVDQVGGFRIKFSFFGEDRCNPLWRTIDDKDIHPLSYTEDFKQFNKKDGGSDSSSSNGTPPLMSNRKLQPPAGYQKEITSFGRQLLNFLKGEHAKDEYFYTPPAEPVKNRFKIGQKLEAIDERFPEYAYPSTVQGIKGEMIKVHYDGYPESFDRWYNFKSRDLFPVGFAKKTGHPIRQPLEREDDGHASDANVPSSSSAKPRAQSGGGAAGKKTPKAEKASTSKGRSSTAAARASIAAVIDRAQAEISKKRKSEDAKKQKKEKKRHKATEEREPSSSSTTSKKKHKHGAKEKKKTAREGDDEERPLTERKRKPGGEASIASGGQNKTKIKKIGAGSRHGSSSSGVSSKAEEALAALDTAQKAAITTPSGGGLGRPPPPNFSPISPPSTSGGMLMGAASNLIVTASALPSLAKKTFTGFSPPAGAAFGGPGVARGGGAPSPTPGAMMMSGRTGSIVADFMAQQRAHGGSLTPGGSCFGGSYGMSLAQLQQGAMASSSTVVSTIPDIVIPEQKHDLILFVRSSCNAGQYLDPAKVKLLPTQFGPASISVLIVEVFQSLMRAVYETQRRKVLEYLPVGMGPLSVAVDVVILEQNAYLYKTFVRHLPLYVSKGENRAYDALAQFLAKLGACPNLVSRTQHVDCACGSTKQELNVHIPAPEAGTSFGYASGCSPISEASSNSSGAGSTGFATDFVKREPVSSGVAASSSGGGGCTATQAQTNHQPSKLVPSAASKPAPAGPPLHYSAKLLQDWSVDDVSAWLAANQDPKIQDLVTAFKEQEISGESLVGLKNDEVMRHFGLKLGISSKLMVLIQKAERTQKEKLAGAAATSAST